MSVRPGRIEPTLLSTKIFCSQAGFGRLKPPGVVQVLLVSVTCVASIWTIWPIFSGSVMRPRRSLTRAWMGRLAFRYAGRPADADVLVIADAGMAITSPRAATAAVTAQRGAFTPGLLARPRPARSPIFCLMAHLLRVAGDFPCRRRR